MRFELTLIYLITWYNVAIVVMFQLILFIFNLIRYFKASKIKRMRRNVKYDRYSILHVDVPSILWHYRKARCTSHGDKQHSWPIRGRHLCDVMVLNRNASIYAPLLLFVWCLFISIVIGLCHSIEDKHPVLNSDRYLSIERRHDI